jgi:superfamily II DNA or RNA helicase
MADIARKIVAGNWPSRKVVADVTPGGGKTRMAMILGKSLLEAGMVNSVVHVVPRSLLRTQVEIDWQESGSGNLLVASDNRSPLYVAERKLGGVVVGAVCTYHQIRSALPVYADWFRSRRCLMICDEAGLLEDNDMKSWGPNAVELHELAAFTLVMSGSFFRNRKTQKVALVDYERRSDGLEYAKADIAYSLAQAIAEHSVKPMEFIRLDASVKYGLGTRDGSSEIEAVLSEAENEDESRALRTFLDLASTWQPLVDAALNHWVDWRRDVYPSRMIVVAKSQVHAAQIVEYIRKKHELEAVQATSDQEDAHEVIETFRGDRKNGKVGSPEILVTVAMAAIGFDVPDITHMVYLSAYRSLPWVLQAFARATRTDPWCSIPAEDQTAFCFVPDDKRMVALIEWMRVETARGVAEPKAPGDGNGEGTDPPQETVVIPLASTPGEFTIDGRTGPASRDDSAEALALISKVPGAAGISPTKLAAVLAYQREHGERASMPSRPQAVASVSPSDHKKALRAVLQRKASQVDSRARQAPGTQNKKLRGMSGGRDRRELTDRDLMGLISVCDEDLRNLPER